MPELFPWEDKHEHAFVRLRQALQELPALGLPNYSKHFILFVWERHSQALGMHRQDHGSKSRPVAYYCIEVEPLAHAYLSGLKAIAAAVELVGASDYLTLGSDINLQTPRTVQSLLNSELTQHFSSNRLTF